MITREIDNKRNEDFISEDIYITGFGSSPSCVAGHEDQALCFTERRKWRWLSTWKFELQIQGRN